MCTFRKRSLPILATELDLDIDHKIHKVRFCLLFEVRPPAAPGQVSFDLPVCDDYYWRVLCQYLLPRSCPRQAAFLFNKAD